MHYMGHNADDDLRVYERPFRNISTVFDGEVPPVLKVKAKAGVVDFTVPFYFLQPSIAILSSSGAPYATGTDMTGECCAIVMRAYDESDAQTFSEPFHTYRKCNVLELCDQSFELN